MRKILLSIVVVLLTGCVQSADQAEVHAQIMLNKAKTEYENRQYNEAVNTLYERRKYIIRVGYSECDYNYQFKSIRYNQCYNYWDNVTKKEDAGEFWKKAIKTKDRESKIARR